MRVLVIEDDSSLRQNLESLLVEAGYACDVAADGRDGLHCALEYPVDLAIIDLGLPEMSGVDIIKKLREAGREVPVLILTARSDWQDKVGGLEAGADDYLTKPFNNEELLARVNALLRRSKGYSDPKIRVGEICLDTSARQIEVSGAVMTTTAYEYKLMECLMLNAGKVMSKTELVEHIYNEEAEHDSNVIEVFVGRLRRKMASLGQSGVIETARGQGYRVSQLSEA